MTPALPWTVTLDGLTAHLLDQAGVVRASVTPQDPDVATQRTVTREARMPEDREVVVTLADGRHLVVANGNRGGLRRTARTVTVELDGRRYQHVHVTDRRSRVLRDGAEPARLRRQYLWRLGARPSAVARPGYAFTSQQPLDDTDELVITLFAVVLGPPGREGAIGRIGHGLSEILGVFS